MASIIRIKRSSVSGNPATLGAGELAYSALTDNGSNGGDRLYIGIGAETSGNAVNHFVIGGKYFTDMLDHTPGTLTASSAIVLDASSKINNLNVGNLTLTGSTNTISSTDTNGNIVLTPNGTGKTVLNNPYINGTTDTLAEFIYDTVGGAVTGTASQIAVTNSDVGNTSTISLINTAVTAGSYGSATAIPVFTVDAQGRLTAASTASITTSLNIAGDTGTDTIALATDTINFQGGTGITSTVTSATNTVDFSIDSTVVTLTGTQTLTNKTLTSPTITGLTISGVNVSDSSIVFEGATADAFETTLFVTDPTADRTVTIPDATGTVVLADLAQTLTNKTIAAGSNTISGLTNSNLSGTAGITNANLANSSVTIGSTTVALGATSTSLAGLTSATFAGSTSGTTQILSGATAGTSVLTLPVATDTLVGKATTDTFTNKTISGASNTLSNIGNASLTNSSVTIGSTSVSLGATVTTFAGLASVTSTTFVGALTGNASTATTLATARNINGVSFNGSTDITVTAAAGTLTGNTLNSGVTASSLTSVGTITSGTWNGTTIAVGSGGTGTTNGSITGTAALTFTAAAGNNNVNLVPTGTGIVDVGGKRVGNAATPTQSSDLTTKAYVDSLSNGLDVKASVRAATTANITLSNTQTIDGVALSVGDRVLVKDQTTGSQNGIYVVASGAWTRATDFDNTPDIEVSPGTFFFVEDGTTQADNGYVVANTGAITIGSTAITFSQFSGAGQITAGDGLTKTGNTINAVGTANRISVATDSIDIASTYVGQSSITTLGTIGTGTWQGTVIGATYGGTGVNNGAKTITLGGSFTHTGAHTLGLTTTANTSVTLPTTGTLATLAGATALGTAAVVLSGGLSVAKAMFIGTNITGAGAATSTLDGFNIDGGTY